MENWKYPDVTTANAELATLGPRPADLETARDAAGDSVSGELLEDLEATQAALGMPGAMAWPATIVFKLEGSHPPRLPRAGSGKA